MKHLVLVICIALFLLPMTFGAHALGTGGVNPAQTTAVNQLVSLGFTVANDVFSQDTITYFTIAAPQNAFFTGTPSATGSGAFGCASASTTITCNTSAAGLGNGTFLVVNAQVVMTVDGTYPFVLTTTDANGGQGTLTHTVTVDSTGPNVTIVSPESRTYSSASVPVTLTIGNDAVQSWYIFDNGANTTYTQSTTVSVSDGNHSLTAAARDSLGNVRSSSVSFVVDATPPSITVTAPAGDAFARENFMLNISVTDGNGINANSVLYRMENATMNGSWQSLQQAGTTYSATVNVASLAESEYTLRIVANDSNQNMQVKTIMLTKDVTAPSVQDVQVGSISMNGSVVSWSTGDATNHSFEYGTSQSFGSAKASGSFVKAHSVVLGDLSASTLYYFRVYACDQAGNCATSSVYNFTTATTNSAATGAVETLTSQNVGVTTTVEYGALTAGSSVSYPVEDADIGVKKIAFEVQNDLKNAALTVNQLKEKPGIVTTPDRAVYKYFEVVRNGIGENDIAKVKIQFMVPKSWLEGKDAKQDSVRLLRFTNGWNDLSTRFVRANGDMLEFEAESPGFSVFAIVATEPVQKRVALAGTGQNVLNENSTQFENLLEEKATNRTSLRVLLFIAALSLVALGGYYSYPKVKGKVMEFRGQAHEHKHTPSEAENYGKTYKVETPESVKRG